MKRPFLFHLSVVIVIAVMVCSSGHAAEKPTDEEAIADISEQCAGAFRTQNTGLLMKYCSDRFEHPEMGDKDGLKTFLETIKKMGVLNDAGLDTASAETTMDGRSATVGPVEVTTAHGIVRWDHQRWSQQAARCMVDLNLSGTHNRADRHRLQPNR